MNQPQLFPSFIESGKPLFTLKVMSGVNTGNRALLIIPPFAEEMNKSRKMMTLLLNRLAEQGVTGYLFDLNGTGDSQGKLEEVSWQSWQDDLLVMLESIVTVHGTEHISLLACRTGALLANACLNHYAEHHAVKVIDEIHYWNPVLNASQFFNQFLRLKLANAAISNSGNKMSVKDLRQQLEDDGYIEVAGYSINAQLVTAMENAQSILSKEHSRLRLYFYEISPLGKLSPGLQSMLQNFTDNGFLPVNFSLKDAPFWSTQEITLSEPLLTQTVSNILTQAESDDV